MKKQLSKIIEALDQAMRRLDELAEATPADRWSARNDPSRWSVAECVAHLNLTSEAYVPLIRQAIADARKLPQSGNGYSGTFIGRMFGALVGPLPSIGRVRIGRVKTPAEFVPSGNLPKNVVVAEFKRLQDELTGMVREGDGLALDKVLITSPFGGKVRYDCYSALVLLPRHQERHLQQAESVWSS
ncbi:MAG: DinB family protein [Gemmatimonadaceae bacterium]